jgi:hypothetical protein
MSLRTPLRCAPGLRQSGMDFSYPVSRHLFLSAQAHLGNMPGYFQPSLAGLAHSRSTRPLFLEKTRGIKRDMIFISHPSQKARRMGHPLVS